MERLLCVVQGLELPIRFSLQVPTIRTALILLSPPIGDEFGDVLPRQSTRFHCGDVSKVCILEERLQRVLTGADKTFDAARVPECVVEFDTIEGDARVLVRIGVYLPMVDPAYGPVDVAGLGFFF